MADLVAQFGLDDSDFRRGLERDERLAVSAAERIHSRTSAVSARHSRVQEQHAERGAAAMRKSMTAGLAAAAAVGKAYDVALRSAMKYGDESGRGRSQVAALRREVELLNQDFGRASFDSGIVQASGFLLRNLRDARRETELIVSDLMSGEGFGSAREKLRLQQRMEAQQVEANRAATYGAEDLSLRAAEARARGDDRAAAELVAQQRTRAMNERLAGLDITPAQRATLRERGTATIRAEEFGKLDAEARRAAEADDARRYAAGNGAVDRIRELETSARVRDLRGRGLHDIASGAEAQAGIDSRLSALRRAGADEGLIGRVNAAEQAAAKAAIEEERREREARRAERLEEYRFQEQSAEIDRLARTGKAQEAALAREMLQSEQAIARIRKDDLLTSAERAGLIEGERRRLGVELETIRSSGTDRLTRSIASGLGGDVLLRRQVLGGGAANVANRQLAVAERQLAVLQEISEKAGVYA